MGSPANVGPEEPRDTRGFAAGQDESPEELGDFTTTRRVIPISLLAIVIGGIAAFVALALLRLIGFFTNFFFYQRWSNNLSSPAGHHLGPFVIVVPVVGAMIVGLMRATARNASAVTGFRKHLRQSWSMGVELNLALPF